MPDCKEYDGINRSELGRLRARLAKENIVVPPGDDVSIEAPFGVELQATYDEAKEILKICILKKPFYVPESQIWKIVDSGTGSNAE